MSQTTINLGFVPKNREVADWDNLPAGTKFYKDNIVQFKGSSYICSPVGYDPEHHTDYFVTVEPWTESPQVLNTGWKVFASGNNKFTTGESVDGLGIDQSPQYGSSGLITSKAVASHGSAFDISEYNKNGNTLATYATLANALAAIPAAAQKGGMSIKFVQSSDNKYVQYRLMSNTFSVTVTDWQTATNEIKAGSKDLAESGGVKRALGNIDIDNSINQGNSIVFKSDSDEVIGEIDDNGAHFNNITKNSEDVLTESYFNNMIEKLESFTQYNSISFVNSEEKEIVRIDDNGLNIEGNDVSEPLKKMSYISSENTEESIIFGTEENPSVVIDNNGIKVKTIKDINGNDIVEKKSISILFIGNSLIEDAISYLPLLLKEITPNLKFKLYDWYNGGKTLKQQYEDYFLTQTPCQRYNKVENTTRWTIAANNTTIDTILNNVEFDILCIQEYFTVKDTYTISDVDDFNNVVSYIRSHYNKPFKVVQFLHPPVRNNNPNYTGMTEQKYQLSVNGNKLIYENSCSEDIIPVGKSIYDSFNTELDSLGDKGHLSPDCTHTQEGIGCLMQAQVMDTWIMKQLGIPKSITNSQTRITQDIYSSINVPGSNLGTGVITGTEAQNILAQKLAINSFK